MKTLKLLPNELIARIDSSGDRCTVAAELDITLLERECAEMTENEIAVRCLQAIVSDRGLFPCESPKLRFEKRAPLSPWRFSAEFKMIPKPALDPIQLIEDLKVSLHEEDLQTIELCRERLITRVQSLLRHTLPESYLKSMPTPVEAIDVWSREVALAALADLQYSGVDINQPRAVRLERAIKWVLERTVEKTNGSAAL